MVLLLFSVCSFAQFDTTWTKIYGGNRDNKAFDIIHTQDSGYLIIGSTSSFNFDNSQMYFLKLDSNGVIQWSKSHGGTNQEAGHSVIQTQDGGYLGVGFTNSWGSGGYDLLLVKLDQNGNTAYERYFGGIDWDFGWDVIEHTTNMFLIAGETQSFGSGGKDAWIVRYDANNDLFDWNKTYGSSQPEYFNAITSTSNGGFIAAGGGIKPTKQDEDVYVVNFQYNGDTLWTQFYGDTLDDHANDIIQRTDADFAITGLYSKPDYQEIYLLQFDTLGVTTDENIWGVNSNRIGFKLQEIDNNRIGVSGSMDLGQGTFDLFYAYSNANSLYYSGGATFGSTEAESGGYFDINPDSTVIIAGNTLGFSSNYSSILLNKTLKDGVINHIDFSSMVDTVNILDINNPAQKNLQVTYSNRDRVLRFNTELAGEYFSIYSILGSQVQTGLINSSNEIPILFTGTGAFILTIPNSSFLPEAIFFH